jgi:dTDP-4-amino-4,6-dideoxygalactose transaminase
MDPELLSIELRRCAELGRLPKAVITTDLYGQCSDYDRIYLYCGEYGVPVIVDAAEALGASNGNRNAGGGAQAAVFSFNGNKIITTSGGGMLVSDDQQLIYEARFLSQQAREPAPHYEHTEIGYNYRMSNILAAIGRGQLAMLDNRVQRKREIFDYYRQSLGDLPGIVFMPEASYGKSNRWLTVILITPEEFGANREMVRLALEEDKIEARPVWKPMHLQPVFDCNVQIPNIRDQGLGQVRRVQARAVGGEVAAALFERGLCLPSGTAMTEEDLERIVSVIRRVAKR